MIQTIDAVVSKLESIIATCIEENNRAGYFAALYHRVTCRIRDGILKNEFEDGSRMQRLDVLFAGRYIQAWEQWRSGVRPSLSWNTAFEAVKNASPIILQHLLLGINAHINLDLGIAAAETMKGYALEDVQKDFNSINNILAALVDEVQNNISKVSPCMILVDRFCKNYDEMVVCFSIDTAREGAWLFAKELFTKAGSDHDHCIAIRDQAIAALGEKIIASKGLLAIILKPVRWFEWRKPGSITNTLKYTAA
jgi:hypothetical protein